MSKRITRTQLRGAPLLAGFCQRAKTTTHEYGQHDNRVFCHGFIDCMTDELCETCAECKAHVRNAEPFKEANMEGYENREDLIRQIKELAGSLDTAHKEEYDIYCAVDTYSQIAELSFAWKLPLNIVEFYRFPALPFGTVLLCPHGQGPNDVVTNPQSRRR